jgi:hypothetical protein
MMLVYLVYEYFTIATHFLSAFFSSMIIRYWIRAYSIEHGIESSGFVLGNVLKITGDVPGRGSRFPENLEI